MWLLQCKYTFKLQSSTSPSETYILLLRINICFLFQIDEISNKPKILAGWVECPKFACVNHDCPCLAQIENHLLNMTHCCWLREKIELLPILQYFPKIRNFYVLNFPLQSIYIQNIWFEISIFVDLNKFLNSTFEKQYSLISATMTGSSKDLLFFGNIAISMGTIQSCGSTQQWIMLLYL